MSTEAGGRGPVIAVTGLVREARIAAGPGVRPLAGGGDPGRLAGALEQAVARGALGIISFGISGGLDPELTPGACLVSRAVVTDQERLPTDPDWADRLSRALSGSVAADIAGVDEPVADPASKRALRAITGAAAADMESHIAARVAAAHSLPFAALRVVCDPACRALPPAVLAGLRPDGTMNGGAVLHSFVRAPRQFSGILRTAFDARVAFGALLRGRSRLGPGLGFPDVSQLLLDVP